MHIPCIGRLITPVDAGVPDLVWLTGSSAFEIEATFRRSSVRVRNCPLHTSCMRHPSPHASTAHGGACCTACQSDLPNCDNARYNMRSQITCCTKVSLTSQTVLCIYGTIPRPACTVLQPSNWHASEASQCLWLAGARSKGQIHAGASRERE